VVYKVMAHELHIYMLFLVAFGFVALAINVMIIQKVYAQLEDYTEELENA
jgi:translation elongation factor EF-1beta